MILATPMMDAEFAERDWTEQLTGEVLVCGLLAKALYASPDHHWLNGLIAEKIFAEIPFERTQPEAAASLSILQGWCAKYPAGLSNADWEVLQDDYTRLFIGPGKLLAPPWQSVYLDRDRLVFQVHTVQVNAYYERFGLELRSDYREPADHVGLQFEFLTHLAELALQALREQDAAKFSELCTAKCYFLRNHMMRWVSRWRGDVEAHARTDFYRGIALLACGMLRDLDRLFGIVTPALKHGVSREANQNSWAAS